MIYLFYPRKFLLIVVSVDKLERIKTPAVDQRLLFISLSCLDTETRYKPEAVIVLHIKIFQSVIPSEVLRK